MNSQRWVLCVTQVKVAPSRLTVYNDNDENMDYSRRESMALSNFLDHHANSASVMLCMNCYVWTELKVS